MCIYIYIYVAIMCVYIYIYIYIHRDIWVRRRPARNERLAEYRSAKPKTGSNIAICSVVLFRDRSLSLKIVKIAPLEILSSTKAHPSLSVFSRMIMSRSRGPRWGLWSQQISPTSHTSLSALAWVFRTSSAINIIAIATIIAIIKNSYHSNSCYCNNNKA